jgi:hypothetical protein
MINRIKTGKTSGARGAVGVPFGVPVNKSELDDARFDNHGSVTAALAIRKALRSGYPRTTMDL